MAFQNIFDWLALRDLDSALEHADDDIVARYARGNTAAQDGTLLMDRTDLDQLSKKADAAMCSLDKMVVSKAHQHAVT